VSRSQETRNWNPDRSFDWRSLRQDLSDPLLQVLQGFFAVEYYTPDYVDEVLHLVRRSHGRSHFQLRWGSEEAKHADTWENALLYSGRRSRAFLDTYKGDLRANVHRSLWQDDPLRNLVYTVFQERATQLNYLNLATIARGRSDRTQHLSDADPVLATVAETIAVDEAAHYNFFLEGLRLFLYYYPQSTLEAIKDVLDHFAMPASTLVPDWDAFNEAVYRAGIYGPRAFARDVVQVVFANLGVESRKALEAGIRRGRVVPTPDGGAQLTTIWDSFDHVRAETAVIRLHDKIARNEAEVGRDAVDPTRFVRNPEWPAT
jgi:acyl-[acyl-carrier-protein] desaturase